MLDIEPDLLTLSGPQTGSRSLPGALCAGVLLFSPQWSAAAPRDSLVAYWTLDNTPLDSALAGGTVDNGTWVGTTSYGAGQFGTGLVLNGSNYISIPSSADVDRTGGDLTVSACFNHLNSQEVS